MDLGTIRNKLNKGEYTSFQGFENDVRLMLRNCYTYNSPGTFVHGEGKTLEGVFENELGQLRSKEEDQNRTISEGTDPISATTPPHPSV